jgi:hypothetical protein
MIPLTVPVIRRLLAACLATPGPPGDAAHWLDWRRDQARAAGTSSAPASPAMLS